MNDQNRVILSYKVWEKHILLTNFKEFQVNLRYSTSKFQKTVHLLEGVNYTYNQSLTGPKTSITRRNNIPFLTVFISITNNIPIPIHHHFTICNSKVNPQFPPTNTENQKSFFIQNIFNIKEEKNLAIIININQFLLFLIFLLLQRNEFFKSCLHH